MVAAAISFLNVCFGLFVLPESLPADRRRPVTFARSNPFGLLRGVARDRALIRLAVVWSCTWIGLGAVRSSLVLFTGYRFGWGPFLSGLVLAGVGLSQAGVEGLTAVFAPLVTAALFHGFTAHRLPLVFPGAPFALAALAAVVAMVLLREL